MTRNVRVPLWFPLLLGAVMAVLFGNMSVLKVEPDLVVSRVQRRVVKVPLRRGGRLQVDGRRLFLRRFDGTWREIPLNTALMRESDWREFSEAVARRRPPNG